MVLHRLRKRAEDDAGFGERVLKGRRYGYGIEDCVDGDTRERGALVQRDAEFLIGAQQLRVDVIKRFWCVVYRLRRRVVADVLKVDARVFDVGPLRLLHRQPVAIGLEPPSQEPLGLLLLGRDEANDVFAQARRCAVGLDVGDKTVLAVVLFV